MGFRSKLLLVIPGLGLGGLVFILFIVYQTINSFTALKQQQLLRELTSQIVSSSVNQPGQVEWQDLLAEHLSLPESSFSVVIQDPDGKILSYLSGATTLVERSYAYELSQDIFNNQLPEQYTTHKGLRYIWYKTQLTGTPESVLLIHASHDDGLSTYFRYLGVPVVIALFVVLWFSVWLAVFLSNLYKKLDTQKQLMEYNALHDPLTGLPNRVLFNDRLEHAIETAKRDCTHFSICMIDLDRFKEINDALGHEYGDKLLIDVSKRIKSVLREVDTIARIGGDEFTIILHNTGKQRATRIAKRISDKLKSEFNIDDEKFHISGSIGISVYPEHGSHPELLIKCADLTMYQAKKHNYDYSIYNPDNDNLHKNSLFLFTDLVDAINNNRFEIFYQPKLDLRTKSITSIEALLRWKHPSQGYIPPNVFIPIAEQTGLIRDITRWGIETVIHEQAILQRNGINVSVSVNLSVHDLDDDRICSFITSLIKKYNAIPENIILEITESAMIFNPLAADKVLSQLHNEGFVISIDDFGTGYSSLSNLQRLHVKEIKIDRSFIFDMHTNENNNRIVRGIIGLAHDLDMNVVAEGTESEDVVNLLDDLGCDMIQGYSVCKPLPLDELVENCWGKSIIFKSR